MDFAFHIITIYWVIRNTKKIIYILGFYFEINLFQDQKCGFIRNANEYVKVNFPLNTISEIEEFVPQIDRYIKILFQTPSSQYFKTKI